MITANFDSQTIYTGDNLHVMRGMNSNCVDLIYLDPPFKSDVNYGEIFNPDDEEKKEIFKDIWTLQDVDLTWWGEIRKENKALYKYLDAVRGIHSPSMMSYLIYMAVRLMEMRRILKGTGSIYLHCDQHASHYLKPLMDSLFGKNNLKREIIWSNEDQSGFKSRAKNWIRGHDTILFYTKGNEYTFNKEYLPLDVKTIKRYDKIDTKDGRRYKIYRNPDGSERRSYLKMDRGAAVPSVWTDIPSFQKVNNTGEYIGYPTQKPLALLKRIILASSNKNEMVLDPFCGCATTCVAADNYGREWVGIDISPEAAVQVKKRITSRLFQENFQQLETLPERTDEDNPKQYKTAKNKALLFGRQAGYCFLCFHKKDMVDMSIDHVIPQAKNGSNRP